MALARAARIMRYSAPMSAADDHYRKLERMYASAPINRFFRPELRVSEGQTELVMPVRAEFFHAANAIHGSVYCADMGYV